MCETKITIGITCYREGDLLRECWGSVLAQTGDRWEAVIVMDGGADEETREVFESIEHPRLRKFAFEVNQGMVPVRNKAVELANTAFSLYLDGDDLIPPNSVAALNRAVEAHPSAAYVFGDVFYYPSGPLKTNIRAVSSAADSFQTGAGGWGLYNVDVWRRLGGFVAISPRGGYGYDTDFKAAVAEAGLMMVHCGETYYYYRVGRVGNMSSGMGRIALDVALSIAQRHPKLFSDKRAKRAFLTPFLLVTVHSNTTAGARGEAMRYTAKGFRELGALASAPWSCLAAVVLGRTVVSRLTPFLGRLWYARKRWLNQRSSKRGAA